ncbi:MAG TPA: element excision factor XisH family protein [Nostocaceae cyanobacterium]|nr:element excision factor XisH family protein [Nostocaceae cyanobacterium]
MAKDKFHNTVKNALIKDGWTITDDPLFLEFGGVDLYVDLGAEKMLAAQKDNQKIAVEVKSFLGDSTISEFHHALGQLLNYRLILRRQDPDRFLYLAVPLDIYESFFKLEFTQAAISDYQLKIIVYHIDQEVISQWIN